MSARADGAVLAAVSGGTDSLALAGALAFVAPRAGLRAQAVVVDHRLQPGSDAVAERAAEQCRGLGLAAEVVAVDVVPGGDGPEAAARTARYAVLERHRAAVGASHVLVAHTKDDQAEQVLLGLLRGSGARSLGGMLDVSGTLLRPFLTIDRSDTEAACRALEVDPWADPHNADERFTRVRVRRLLGELRSGLDRDLTDNLARTARLAREDNDALDAWAREAATTDVVELHALPRAVRTRVVRSALLDSGADAAALGFAHLDEVDRLLTDWHGQGPIDVPGGLQVRRREGALVIEPRRRVE